MTRKSKAIWAVAAVVSVSAVAGLALIAGQERESTVSATHVPAAMQARMDAAARISDLKALVVSASPREPQINGTVTATAVVVGSVSSVKETNSYSLPSSNADGSSEGPDWRTHAITVDVKKCVKPDSCDLNQIVVGLATGRDVTAEQLMSYFSGKRTVFVLEPATPVFADSPEIEFSVPFDGELIGVSEKGQLTYPFATDASEPTMNRIAPTEESLKRLG